MIYRIYFHCQIDETNVAVPAADNVLIFTKMLLIPNIETVKMLL